ncbi:AbgT family transporter [[Clostridium] colinum]|uniref:AbgT family transporter n=1 Tax=[Clostridium] colinum TaxID=36835 RepID=UPI0020245272|nr:AbgT family transporter [[Clostridium] colinum]
MGKKENIKKKNSFFDKFLNSIEVAGNKLPHPITLFTILSLLIVILSAIFEALGISATGEIMNQKTMELEEQTITTVSLLSGEGIAYMIKNAISNFTGFAPLGVVLVTMLGVGCAEGSGYITASMKKLVSKTPVKLITPVVVFLGVMSNVASDVGYVVLVPIGAIVFMAYKRHPLAGLAAAFAGVSGGFSANLLIGTVDTLLSGISTEAAQILDPSYTVGATANWFFMFVSTALIVIVGTFVTDKIVEPRLGKFDTTDETVSEATELTPQENKALKYANFTLIAYILLIVLWAIPKNSLLRNPETGSLISKSLLIDGIIVFITLGFFIPSIVYGRVSGTYKSEKDIGDQLGKNMASMGSYIALTFVAAQFVNYFNYTNLGSILALKGADFLGNIGLTGAPLMVLFIILTAFINLFMGSASAKWTILAPVFIPMFMQLGYSPELTQVAYRIGDSTTNIISPLMNYFAMIVVFAKKYDKRSGIGTLISTMLPYSIMFLIGWTILLVIWIVLDLPLGPGVSMFY